jgi:hypothetical protein
MAGKKKGIEGFVLENKGILWAKNNLWVLLLVVLIILFAVLIWFIRGLDIYTPEVILSILLVIGVIALILTLCCATIIIHLLGLSDPTNSMGLPKGSVRAVIALSLILIFMLSSVYLYSQVDSHGGGSIYNLTNITQAQLDAIPVEEIAFIQQAGTVNNETIFNVGRMVELEANGASVDIAKQIITTVSTLVVAVAGFYFGSNAVAGAVAAAGGVPAISVPVIRSIKPDKGEREKDIPLKVFGKNLELAEKVKLVRGSVEIASTDVTSSPTMVKCRLNIPDDSEAYPAGKWSVVVINSDTGRDQLLEAFTVIDTEKPVSETEKPVSETEKPVSGKETPGSETEE